MHAIPPTDEAQTEPWFGGKRVLVVDDSRAIRLYLDDVLARSGALVTECADGESAVGRIESGERYDLVLLDLNLPDLEGVDVLARIRARDEDVPVVVITGVGGIQSATRAVRLGADGYIEKQHLTSGDDDLPFLHALRQAVDHRAGQVAQRQLQDMKAEFYSIVTHDLRNPAGAVWSVLKMLVSGKAGDLNPRQAQMVEIAERSAGKLMSLINDYLDYAAIDGGFLRLDRHPSELRGLVQEAARMAGPQAGAKKQAIYLELPPAPVEAMVDAARLEQVLENLVSNAVKYTPEGGWITLALAVDGETATIRVKDTGIGIAPEQVPLLFRPFGRVPGERTRGIRGTGLGLMIVKEIVEGHGGSVTVQSDGRPGHGTTFTVALPLRLPEDEGTPAPQG